MAIQAIRRSWLWLAPLLAAACVCVFVLLRVHQYRSSTHISQPSEIIAQALELIQANALKGKRADWPEIQASANEIARNNGGERELDLDRALRFLVSKLGDGHSSYLSRAEVQALSSPTPTAPNKPESMAHLSIAKGHPLIAVQSFMSLELMLNWPLPAI